MVTGLFLRYTQTNQRTEKTSGSRTDHRTTNGSGQDTTDNSWTETRNQQRDDRTDDSAQDTARYCTGSRPRSGLRAVLNRLRYHFIRHTGTHNETNLVI